MVKRKSTIESYKNVFKLYNDLKLKHGELFNELSKEYIYKSISNKTKMHPKTVARILNHEIIK